VLSRVYQLVTSYLHKYGAPTATQAALAADRALVAAERSGDPVQIGAASRRVAKSLVYQQRPEAAVEFATAAARRLEGDLAAQGPLGPVDPRHAVPVGGPCSIVAGADDGTRTRGQQLRR
jgi:hypothetical protein